MKKLIIRLIIFSIPFVFLVLNYWLITLTKDRSGDLGRVGHRFFEKNYHGKLSPNVDEQFVKDVFIDSLPDSVFILSVGDSFSNKLLSVQRWNEYFGKVFNQQIINIPPCDKSPANIVLSILTEYPDNRLPQVILMETVEREAIPILSALNFKHNESLNNIKYLPKNSFGISTDFLHNVIEFYQRQLGMNVHLVFSDLNKPVFSSKGDESKLICYYQDTSHFSNKEVKMAVDNLKRLHKLAEYRGVQLFYLICPNKANVYWPYITEKDKKKYYNILDCTSTFDTLQFVFSPLQMLRNKVSQGEKDVFYCDDSHWPPKTAKNVGIAMAEFVQSILRKEVS